MESNVAIRINNSPSAENNKEANFKLILQGNLGCLGAYRIKGKKREKHEISFKKSYGYDAPTMYEHTINVPVVRLTIERLHLSRRFHYLLFLSDKSAYWSKGDMLCQPKLKILNKRYCEAEMEIEDKLGIIRRMYPS